MVTTRSRAAKAGGEEPPMELPEKRRKRTKRKQDVAEQEGGEEGDKQSRDAPQVRFEDDGAEKRRRTELWLEEFDVEGDACRVCS